MDPFFIRRPFRWRIAGFQSIKGIPGHHLLNALLKNAYRLSIDSIQGANFFELPIEFEEHLFLSHIHTLTCLAGFSSTDLATTVWGDDGRAVTDKEQARFQGISGNYSAQL